MALGSGWRGSEWNPLKIDPMVTIVMAGNQTLNAFKIASMPCSLGEERGALLRKTDPSAASLDGRIIAEIHPG